jgi:hypothetical protein
MRTNRFADRIGRKGRTFWWSRQMDATERFVWWDLGALINGVEYRERFYIHAREIDGFGNPMRHLAHMVRTMRYRFKKALPR